MAIPVIYADFNNLDESNRLRLDRVGTIADLKAQGVELGLGLMVTVYMDDADDEGRPDKLLADAVVEWNEEENCWVAVIDWDKIYHESEQALALAAGGQLSRRGLLATAASGMLGMVTSPARSTEPRQSLPRQPLHPQQLPTTISPEPEPRQSLRIQQVPPTILPPNLPPPKLPSEAKPKLVVIRGLKRGLEYPICEGGNLIGRTGEEPVDIDLKDLERPDRIWSSRQHCIIKFEDGQLTLEDLYSQSGTFVNRTRVYPGHKQSLAEGDVIQIGPVQLKLKT